MNIALVSLLGKAEMPWLKKKKQKNNTFLEQLGRKELNAFNVAKTMAQHLS